MPHKATDREERTFKAGEIRLDAGAAGGLSKLIGHAAVFNKKSEWLTDLDGSRFREVILPGAFKQTLADGADVRALVGHDPDKIIGRTKSGTLELEEDEKGLRVEISPSNTQAGRDIVVSVDRGDVDAMSFGFRTIEDRWSADNAFRELVSVELFDVSPVAYPAYQATDLGVALRSLQRHKDHADCHKTDATTGDGVTEVVVPPVAFDDDSESVKRNLAALENSKLATKPV